MKPPAFEYAQPRHLEEALILLSDSEDAKVLAGGQSLIPMMNMRLAHPGQLVDINQLSELANIQVDADGTLHIGALVRHYQLEEDPLIRRHAPVVATAEGLIAHSAIRTRGTIGGSLAHADPAAELPVLAVLLDWQVIATSLAGERHIPASEFFLSYFITDLAPNELVTRIDMPALEELGAHITEFTIRAGDFALAIAAAGMTLDANRHIQSLRMALGGVADIPWRDRELEKKALGQVPSEALWHQLASQAVEAIDPPDDLHATASYRRQLAKTLLIEALQQAHKNLLERSAAK